ncbi:DUF4157 domain-containing protein [Plasticicumulans sp.]|uniref:eCIS core domain-containing protein n=1 Tax=Plasticicumulans sp. TaxID=2307179 RepID=UPI0039220EA3
MSSAALLARRLHGSTAPATAAKPARATPAARAALPGYLQARLRLSQPGDALEQEAERAAEAVAQNEAPAVKPAATATLARSAAGDGALSPAIEQRIEASRSHGEPLAPAVRADMESRFGSDFGGVRTHTGAEAADLSRALDAQAFTSGSDVFFDSGRYAPAAPEGRALLAHELTHVVQQGASPAAARQVQRAKGDGGAGTKTKGTKPKSEIRLDGQRVIIPELKISAKKAGRRKPAYAANTELRKGPRKTSQRAVWGQSLKPGVVAGLEKDVKSGKGNFSALNADGSLCGAKLPGGRLLIGSQAAVADELTLPKWTARGASLPMDVDHFLEWQLNGNDALDNYVLGDAALNQAAGSITAAEIDRAVESALNELASDAANPADIRDWQTLKTPAAGGTPGAAPAPGAAPGAAPAPAAPATPAAGGGTATTTATAAPPPQSRTRTAVKELQSRNYTFVFERIEAAADTGAGYWLPEDISAGKSLKVPDRLDKKTLETLTGKAGGVLLLPREWSGTPLPAGTGKWQGSAAKGKGVTVQSYSAPSAGAEGSVVVEVPVKDAAPGSTPPVLTLPVRGHPDLPGLAAARITRKVLKDNKGNGGVSGFRIKTLSPVEFTDLGLSDGWGVEGSGLLTIDSLPFLKGAQIGVMLIDGELGFAAIFDAGEFKLGGPLKMTGGNLALAIVPGGPLQASGRIDFALGEYASGSIAAGAGPGGVTLDGSLAFEKGLFSGEGHLRYAAGKWSADGSFTLQRKFPGVDKLSLTLGYDGETQLLRLGGDADLSVPGFRKASCAVAADAAGNIALSGSAELADTLPKIKAGRLTLTLNRPAGGDWSFGGSGELEPDLKGVPASAKLLLSYADGLVTGKLAAAYATKLVGGTLTLNAKAGVGEQPEPLKVWGSGNVDFKAAPWLKATVGLTLAEDGSLTVAGKLGIPAPVELFPKKEYKKQILPLAAPSIPIFGFAVAGVNVGVFLNIDGSLDFIASFGPGQLTEASVGITWSPDDEDATELDGKATFVIPAYAGLKLTVDAGLGVGAAVISAIGGLSVWGELGVKASAGLGVDLKWKPGLGIKLNGEAKADAEAVLKLGAGGFIKVVAKIIGTIYEERFPAGEFTLGSGLKIGVTLPVSYEPDKSFELDFSKIDIRTPEISAGDLVDKIKDQLPSP